jgi:hypothetical protein
VRVIGIDPGLKIGKDGGGLACIEMSLLGNPELLAEPMPILPAGGLDEQKVCELICAWRPGLVVLEALGLYAGGKFAGAKGLAGQLRGAAAWGFLRGVVVDQGWRLVEVAPQTWQAWAWREGVRSGALTARPQKGTTKLAAEQLAKLWFSGVDFRLTARSRCVHTGMVDASLIALYGQRQLAAGR